MFVPDRRHKNRRLPKERELSSLLELLGKGLQSPLRAVVLPDLSPLSDADTDRLSSKACRSGLQHEDILRLAVHHAQGGAIDQAEHLLSSLLEHDKHNLQAHLAWAALCAGNGLVEEALAKLQKAHECHHDNAYVLFGLGYCYERLGQIDLAEKYYRQAASARPYLPHPRQRLAAINVLRRECSGAIDEYQNLQREHPEDVSIYLVLGQLYLEMDQNQDAQEAFERALTVEPDNFELRHDHIESLVRDGKITEALQQLHLIIEKQGEFPDSYVRLADLYSRLDDDEAALDNYNKALQLHPGYLEAAVKLGTQHMRMNRFLDAAVTFSRAVEINDRLITAYIGLAIAQQRLGKSEQASDIFELAAALEPNTNLLFAELARLQLKATYAKNTHQNLFNLGVSADSPQQQVDDALSLQMERHRQALIEQPNRADCHYRYALLLRGRGHTEEALGHLQHALEINPSYLKARVKIGLTLHELGKTEQARRHFEQALVLDASFIEMHYKLALMYCDKIQFALAVEHCQVSLPGKMERDQIHANLGLALQNMGLIDPATANWRALCELEPDHALAFQAQRAVMSLRPIR